jgi:hypothetical protein
MDFGSHFQPGSSPINHRAISTCTNTAVDIDRGNAGHTPTSHWATMILHLVLFRKGLHSVLATFPLQPVLGQGRSCCVQTERGKMLPHYVVE